MKKTFLLITVIIFLVACQNISLPSPTSSAPVTQVIDITTLVTSTAPEPMLPTSIPTVSTPTLASSSTSTPEPEIELAVTSTQDASERIYIWNANVYGYFDPLVENQYQPVFLNSTDDTLRGPSQAISFTFSQNTRRIAYLTESNGNFELWHADLGLQNIRQLWLDENQQLGVYSGYKNPSLKWGPGDNFLLLSSENSTVLYSFVDASVIQLAGACDRIILSRVSNNLSLMCPISAAESIVLEQDGSKWVVSTSSQNNELLVQDWVFSPNGEKVLYTSQGNLAIMNKLNEHLELSIEYVPPRGDVTQRILQWSDNGKEIFVFGIPSDKNICPNRDLPCWVLLNADNGELIWWPTDEVAIGFGASSWEGYGYNWDATLFPNGEMILLLIDSQFGTFGIVTSVTGNVTYVVFVDFLPSAIDWER